jgi:hypothetical protein
MVMARDFPNNWDLYKEAPDDAFVEHSYDEIMEWKVLGWELPSSVCCIIRARNKESPLFHQTRRLMSIITLDEFPEFVDANPEMEQCYGSLLDMHMDHTDGMNWGAWEANFKAVAESLGITVEDLMEMELNGEVAYGYA